MRGRDVCTQGTFWGCWNLKQLTALASLGFLALSLTLHTIHLPRSCWMFASHPALSHVGWGGDWRVGHCHPRLVLSPSQAGLGLHGTDRHQELALGMNCMEQLSNEAHFAFQTPSLQTPGCLCQRNRLKKKNKTKNHSHFV